MINMLDLSSTTFNDIRPLVKARLLSDHHGLTDLVKDHVSADIWKTYYIDLSKEEYFAGVSITNKMLDLWNVTARDIKEAADSNITGSQTMKSLIEILGISDIQDACPAYVISNRDGLYGAISVLNKDIQDRIRKMFPEGFFILPSSVHEVIVIPDETQLSDERFSPAVLTNMVSTINSAMVSEKDRLSDHVFTLKGDQLAMVA